MIVLDERSFLMMAVRRRWVKIPESFISTVEVECGHVPELCELYHQL
jgi:hypothetical protein